MTKHLVQGSFLCKLDPRIKILLVSLFTVLVFVVDELPLAAGQTFVFVMVYIAAGIPVKKLAIYGKFLPALGIVIILLQMLFGTEQHAGHYILKPLVPEFVPLLGGSGSLKWDGLFTGLMIICRLAALALLLPMLTLTTDTRLFAMGLTRLGLHYSAAYIITSAFNLVPSFEVEARAIMEAKKLRGMRAPGKGRHSARIGEYAALALPLIIHAMRQAQMMGIAMDSRGFGAYRTRTWLLEIKMTRLDYRAFAAGTAYAFAVLALRFCL
jgi:energy-coupling factor transport system permease protein